jgi:ABC-type transport system involved in Fe-S cluster assembly fused permease/ATPase subunit
MREALPISAILVICAADEPSSGLEAQAEHAIHQSLRRHRAGRTSLLISHRLGAVREADVIVVLAEGRSPSTARTRS